MLSQLLHHSGHARGAVNGISARDKALRLAVAIALSPRGAKNTQLRVKASAASNNILSGEVAIPLGNGVSFFILKRSTFDAFNIDAMSNESRSCQPQDVSSVTHAKRLRH